MLPLSSSLPLLLASEARLHSAQQRSRHGPWLEVDGLSCFAASPPEAAVLPLSSSSRLPLLLASEACLCKTQQLSDRLKKRRSEDDVHGCLASTLALPT